LLPNSVGQPDLSITLVERLAGTSFNVRTELFQERIGYTENNSVMWAPKHAWPHSTLLLKSLGEQGTLMASLAGVWLMRSFRKCYV
jgi:hypothetical protein